MIDNVLHPYLLVALCCGHVVEEVGVASTAIHWMRLPPSRDTAVTQVETSI